MSSNVKVRRAISRPVRESLSSTRLSASRPFRPLSQGAFVRARPFDHVHLPLRERQFLNTDVAPR